MRQVVTDQRYAPFFLQWAQERLPDARPFDPALSRTIAHVKGDDVLGVWVLHSWNQHGCEVALASDGSKRWASRPFFFTLYDYVFRHANKARLTCLVAAENVASATANHKAGHVLEGRIRDFHGPGRDLLIFGFTKADWLASRWSRAPTVNTTRT